MVRQTRIDHQPDVEEDQQQAARGVEPELSGPGNGGQGKMPSGHSSGSPFPCPLVEELTILIGFFGHRGLRSRGRMRGHRNSSMGQGMSGKEMFHQTNSLALRLPSSHRERRLA